VQGCSVPRKARKRKRIGSYSYVDFHAAAGYTLGQERPSSHQNVGYAHVCMPLAPAQARQDACSYGHPGAWCVSASILHSYRNGEERYLRHSPAPRAMPRAILEGKYPWLSHTMHAERAPSLDDGSARSWCPFALAPTPQPHERRLRLGIPRTSSGRPLRPISASVRELVTQQRRDAGLTAQTAQLDAIRISATPWDLPKRGLACLCHCGWAEVEQGAVVYRLAAR